MPRLDALRPEIIEYAPETLEEGVLYVSLRFELALHKCPCGCGEKVVTPLGPGEWGLTLVDGLATLQPSLLNRFECKSHYWIVRNQIQWA